MAVAQKAERERERETAARAEAREQERVAQQRAQLEEQAQQEALQVAGCGCVYEALCPEGMRTRAVSPLPRVLFFQGHGIGVFFSLKRGWKPCGVIRFYYMGAGGCGMVVPVGYCVIHTRSDEARWTGLCQHARGRAAASPGGQRPPPRGSDAPGVGSAQRVHEECRREGAVGESLSAVTLGCGSGGSVSDMSV